MGGELLVKKIKGSLDSTIRIVKGWKVSNKFPETSHGKLSSVIDLYSMQIFFAKAWNREVLVVEDRTVRAWLSWTDTAG